MSCSFCHFTGHTITTCRSTVLLELMTEVNGVANSWKNRCITVSYSKAVEFVNFLTARCSLRELKGIAAMCHIPIRKMKFRELVFSITLELYYENREPSHLLSLNDALYYAHLNRCTTGRAIENDSWNEYLRELNYHRNTINMQTHGYNIHLLISNRTTYARLLSEGSIMLDRLICTFRAYPNSWVSHSFGDFITYVDLRLHAPFILDAIDNYMTDYAIDLLIESIRNVDAVDYSDVVLTQKLVIHCEYKKDVICEETADECIICYDNIKCNTMLNCGHAFCVDCITTSIKMVTDDHRMKAKCSACREEIKSIQSTDFEKINKLSEYLA